MSGFELGVLKRRLQPQFHPVAFSYPSLSGSMADHARSLVEFARAQKAEELHFVGHSLGGLVILRALQLANDLPPGKAVLLGTPLQGSKAAQGVARWMPFAKTILGAAAHEEVIEAVAREWVGERDVGIIAGSLGMGLGRLFAAFDTDHDGTVSVAETQLPGARDHIVMPTSHTGLLFSADVAEQSAHFLSKGAFRR
jgi:pimeloyl-ACP methyl ester carboxylesterase